MLPPITGFLPAHYTQQPDEPGRPTVCQPTQAVSKTSWTFANVQGEILQKGDSKRINLNNVADGMYIITTPKRSYKVVKK